MPLLVSKLLKGFSHKQAWIELLLYKMFCRGMTFKLHGAKLLDRFTTVSEPAKKRTNFLMNKNVQDRIASKERRFISGREKLLKTPPKTVIMCIGMVGTGVWSRIKGHAKRSGGQFRRVVPVAMTNEFMSSQHVATALTPLSIQKKEADSGPVQNCGQQWYFHLYQPQVFILPAGKNCQNRDIQASKCIAIAAASRMLTCRRLACFDNTNSYHTGQHTLPHRISPQRYFDINGNYFSVERSVFTKDPTATLAVR